MRADAGGREDAVPGRVGGAVSPFKGFRSFTVLHTCVSSSGTVGTGVPQGEELGGVWVDEPWLVLVPMTPSDDDAVDHDQNLLS